MKNFFIIFLILIFSSNAYANTSIKLPKDVSSGSKFEKSLTGKYYKKYGYQIVNKADGHPVRSGEQSIRFEVRDGNGWGWDSRNDRERVELLICCVNKKQHGQLGLYIYQTIIK